MFLVDSHCHLNKEYFEEGLDAVFAKAAETEVKCMLVASSDVVSSSESVCIAEQYRSTPEIYAAVGIHPHEAVKVNEVYIDDIENFAKNPRVLAIGEIGLDYFYDISPRITQKDVFENQIELAKKIGKPIIIHVRDAQTKAEGDAIGDLLSLLRGHNARECGGVIHCFTGNAEEARAALEMGFYISFAGPLTYPRNRALREIAADIPIDRILCETDSPYLAPQGHRGEKNEPCNVRCVYECIAMLRGLPVEKFADIVHENFMKAFHIGEI